MANMQSAYSARSAILAFNSRRFYSDIHTFIEASKAAAPPPESDAFPSAAFVLARPILYCTRRKSFQASDGIGICH
jgi:hypothetical protein